MNVLFQKNDVEIGDAYEEIIKIICILGGKIFEPQFLNGDVFLILNNFDNNLPNLKHTDADFGIYYIRALRVQNQ